MTLVKRALWVVILVWLGLFFWRPSVTAPQYVFFDSTEFDVIAHRGGKGLAPENTLVAFALAAELGTDVLELDVHGTADGELIVIHDATLLRTTEADGAVAEKTLTELSHLNAGYRFEVEGQWPYRDASVQLPTLNEVFSRHPNSRFIVEIKQVVPSIAERLCQEIRQHNLLEHVIVGSFHTRTLEDFRAACPQALTSASRGEVTEFFILNLLGLSHWYDTEAVAFQVPLEFSGITLVDERFVRNVQAQGIAVQVWTINDADVMRGLIDLGVDGIITDYPDRLIELLDPTVDLSEGGRSE